MHLCRYIGAVISKQPKPATQIEGLSREPRAHPADIADCLQDLHEGDNSLDGYVSPLKGKMFACMLKMQWSEAPKRFDISTFVHTVEALPRYAVKLKLLMLNYDSNMLASYDNTT